MLALATSHTPSTLLGGTFLVPMQVCTKCTRAWPQGSPQVDWSLPPILFMGFSLHWLVTHIDVSSSWESHIKRTSRIQCWKRQLKCQPVHMEACYFLIQTDERPNLNDISLVKANLNMAWAASQRQVNSCIRQKYTQSAFWATVPLLSYQLLHPHDTPVVKPVDRDTGPRLE